MSLPVVGRSPQEIDEDSVIELHTSIQRNLNQVCNGRTLYRGLQREALRTLLEEIEKHILGEEIIHPPYGRSLGGYLNARYLCVLSSHHRVL